MTDRPRPASASEAQAAQATIAAAYRKYLSRMDRPPAPMLSDISPDIDAGRVWLVGQPVTGVICLISDDDGLLVENVAVHPDAQGTGLGRQLMDFAEDEARRLGLDRLWLYTNEVMTENIAIYTHLGYHEVKRQIEDGYRRVFMEKVLPPA